MTSKPATWIKLVARTGFEPVISALRGRCPWPLDERALESNCTHSLPACQDRITVKKVAGDRGFEPRLSDSESDVLPLD